MLHHTQQLTGQVKVVPGSEVWGEGGREWQFQNRERGANAPWPEETYVLLKSYAGSKAGYSSPTVPALARIGLPWAQSYPIFLSNVMQPGGKRQMFYYLEVASMTAPLLLQHSIWSALLHHGSGTQLLGRFLGLILRPHSPASDSAVSLDLHPQFCRHWSEEHNGEASTSPGAWAWTHQGGSSLPASGVRCREWAARALPVAMTTSALTSWRGVGPN